VIIQVYLEKVAGITANCSNFNTIQEVTQTPLGRQSDRPNPEQQIGRPVLCRLTPAGQEYAKLIEALRTIFSAPLTRTPLPNPMRIKLIIRVT